MHTKYDSYIELKRDVLRNGLLSCSQVGFNIAIGPLADLRDQLARLFRRMFEPSEAWDVPAFIREDWIPGSVWDNPRQSQWIRTSPLQHILTPVPSMHLLNRLRHHPATGRFHLAGVCSRQEQDTLPLLRQISFGVHELVDVTDKDGNATEAEQLFQHLAGLAEKLKFPVTQSDPVNSATRLMLHLPETPGVTLVTMRELRRDLLAAYSMEWAGAGSVACGLERWCLAIIATYGANPGAWPDLDALKP